MKIGMITCNYFMRIYDYIMPDPLDWFAMCDKYRKEFTRDDFITLVKEIREIGFDHLEIWEPMFSHQVYSEAEAANLAKELAGLGFKSLAYCIGGWNGDDIPQVEPAYKFAKALGSEIVTGTIKTETADKILPEVERCGKKYGLLYAIENHPKPSAESPEEVLQLCTPYSTVGANLDTGIYNMQRFDVDAAANLLKDQIYHVHFKDTIKGDNKCKPIGDGDWPIDKMLLKLQEWGYDRMVSVEFEFEGDPRPGLIKSMKYINDVLKRG